MPAVADRLTYVTDDVIPCSAGAASPVDLPAYRDVVSTASATPPSRDTNRAWRWTASEIPGFIGRHPRAAGPRRAIGTVAPAARAVPHFLQRWHRGDCPTSTRTR